MEKYITLAGAWKAEIPELGHKEVILPGTLDENHIGFPDQPDLAGRLTRKYTYTGEVSFRRTMKLPETLGGRWFLEAERARILRLKINGAEVTAFRPGSLSTPWVFEVTAFAGQEVEICLVSDNRYLEFDHKGILHASAATDETQTNWNGILGYFRLRWEEKNFIETLRIYPEKGKDSLRIEADLCLDHPAEVFQAESPVFACGQVTLPVEEFGPFVTVKVSGIQVSSSVKLWDEEEGNLYPVRGALDGGVPYEDRLGLRWFGVNENVRLTINGRVFFLRGEANCCVFPETGHPPMEKEQWVKVLKTYQSYGVNCMRFHSWCPPKAAFQAADELGMMMQPELSHWNCETAFEEKGAFPFYEHELYSILRQYANHPSFVMLTFGNELHAGPAGHSAMERLLQEARQFDGTRLYAKASNCHYGEKGADQESDFYTSMAYYQEILRATSPGMEGHLNHEYPSSCHDYQKAAAQIVCQGKPVFGFEVGQYESLPDFGEISQFQGVTRPLNLEIIQDNAGKAGMLPRWKEYCEATGELALICYREEVEAVLRTPAMSGLSLLGLQDFTGQGTALVGMLNGHLEPKPFSFAEPDRFAQFFGPVLPLLLLPKYTYTEGEAVKALVKLANYGKTEIKGKLHWRLTQGEETMLSGELKPGNYPPGELWEVGQIAFELPRKNQAYRCDLEIAVGGMKNQYPLWVYPEIQWMPENVEIVEALTAQMIKEIKEGKQIFFEPFPNEKNLPCSIGGQFSTDFWSVENFPQQEGGMGMVIDAAHPALAQFPTESHSNWQWWIPSHGRPVILPKRIRPIITVPDCHSRLKHMGLLAEFRLGKGAVLFSSMGLHFRLEYPETKALLHSILTYAEGGIRPEGEMTEEELMALAGL